MNCSSIPPPPPPDMSFTLSILWIILIYAAVFTIALVGNVTMFLILCRLLKKRRSSLINWQESMVKVRRVHSLLLHMNIAHLMVTIIYMPQELLHAYMISWDAGDVLCRLCKFFDVFSVTLSASILICISLDRFYSIFFPLYAMRARRSVNRMVVLAWAVSFVTSVPQFFLWRTAEHPCYTWYVQCVSRNFIKEVSDEVVFYFSIFNIVQVYFLPLVVTLICYSLILFRISSGARNTGGNSSKCVSRTSCKSSRKSSVVVVVKDEALLRRSTAGNLERARSRTLRMTFVIVAAFLFCWTPYAISMFLHFTFPHISRQMPKEMRKLLYAFAVFNSAITPYLYGYFSFDLKKEIQLLIRCSKATVSERHLSHSTNPQSFRSCRTPSSRRSGVHSSAGGMRSQATMIERDVSSSELLHSIVSNGASLRASTKRNSPVSHLAVTGHLDPNGL